MKAVLVCIFVFVICAFFWWLAGLIADWLLPKLLNRFKLWKTRDCTYPSRCPMLECKDTGCYYFDKECLSCKFSEVSDEG